jgi:hypothetical protein
MCKIGEHEVRIDAVRAGLQTYNNENNRQLRLEGNATCMPGGSQGIKIFRGRTSQAPGLGWFGGGQGTEQDILEWRRYAAQCLVVRGHEFGVLRRACSSQAV